MEAKILDGIRAVRGVPVASADLPYRGTGTTQRSRAVAGTDALDRRSRPR